MYHFFSKLSPDERAALASMTADYLVDLLSPVGDTAKVTQATDYEGETLTVVASDYSLEFKSAELKRLQNHYGDSQPLNGSLMNYLVAAGKLPKQRPPHREAGQASFGLLLANRVNGRMNLFDSPVEASDALELSLSQANFVADHNLDGRLNKVRPSAGAELWEIRLSGEQYVRVMRANEAVVPCTISREDGYLHDMPPREFKPQVQTKDALRAEMTALVEPLKAESEALIELLKNGSFTSKKRLAEVRERVETIKSLYTDIGKQASLHKQARAQEMVQQFAHDLQKQWQNEVRRLPESVRGQLYLPTLNDHHDLSE